MRIARFALLVVAGLLVIVANLVLSDRDVWVIANLTIACVYYVLALNLGKLLGSLVNLTWWTRLGMTAFFILCGFTHLEHAFHLIITPDQPIRHMLQPHSLWMHQAQAVAVVVFLSGVLHDLHASNLRTDRTIRELRGALHQASRSGE